MVVVTWTIFHVREVVGDCICGGRRVKIPRLILPFIVVEYLESGQNKSNPILPSIKGIL
jgi:hypothetical protein